MKLHRLLPFLLLSLSGIAQDHFFPDGIYLNIDQLRNRYPAIEAQLRITQRTHGDIMMMGGNDYKLEPVTDTVDKHFIQKKVFAYVHGDSILLNGNFHQLPPFFALCLTDGAFLVFKAGESTDQANTALMFGAIGGAISAMSRYLYVLSLRTGNVRFLTQEYVTSRLKENPALLHQYNAEPHPGSDATLIRYMDLFNKTLKLNPNVLTR
jgi:hypothetical protein